MTNEPSKTEPAAPIGFWAKLWHEIIRPYGEAILFAILITTFVFTSVGVEGTSMMPNLRTGERVIIPKYEQWLHRFGIGSYSRGDILVFKPPQHPNDPNGEAEKTSFFGLWSYYPFLIKRLIGLPGEKVKIKNGEVFINGNKIDQSFTTDYWKKQGCWDQDSAYANTISRDQPDLEELTIPANNYFLMGDNRTIEGSKDSRYFGPIPIDQIAGRATFVLWPFIRKTEDNYDCKSPSPTEGFTLSGDTIGNWRVLRPPDGLVNVK